MNKMKHLQNNSLLSTVIQGTRHSGDGSNLKKKSLLIEFIFLVEIDNQQNMSNIIC